jgi:hypothetical protein
MQPVFPFAHWSGAAYFRARFLPSQLSHAMLEFFRRHRGAFMITLTVVIIISFASWGGTRTDGQKMATTSDDAFTIYGDKYTVAEMQRLERSTQIIQMLQMYELYFGLMSAARSPESGGRDFVFNMLVLKRQMEELGIHPSDEAAKAELEKTQALQENGVFSQQRAFNLQQNLGMYGMGGQDMLDIAKLSLGYKRLQELIGKNYVPSPVETEKAYASRHQTLKIQTINFALDDFKKTAEVKEDELKKYYDENKESYKSIEKRAVSYVLFANPADLDKKPLEERTKLQKEQVARVEKFNEASIAPGAKFDEIVNKLKEKAETAALFAKDTPPDAIKDEKELIDAIFAHNKDSRPISDPVKGTKGYYVFSVTKVEEPKQQELAEVKDKVKEVLVGQKAQEALSKAVNDARTALQEGLKAGKKIDDLAKEKKLTLAAVKELTVNEPPTDLPNAQEIATEAQKVAAGEVAKAVNTDKGATLVYVAARELRKRDDSAALRKNTEDRNASQERQRLFQSWFNQKREEAGLQVHLKMSA